ncbi:hypothetical protein [Mucilaginibacter gotjawali]|uniref:Uncharacterized protein n=1 Tax=Mucilaginibacter gotjawali TaxID=1550579 RepID=A0A839SAD3_9SPHI|nr:hypothetical protein [Mucilaginibacter gotjawali]MBB3054786.1 hypothetical protein [Mucilaginibacter gotjawali]
MKEINLQILLSNVESNGTINSLLDRGLGFKDIADLTEAALIDGFIIYSTEEMKLSEAGLEKLSELRSQMKRVSKKEWIDPEEKSKISKINLDFIFLPEQDDIP